MIRRHRYHMFAKRKYTHKLNGSDGYLIDKKSFLAQYF